MALSASGSKCIFRVLFKRCGLLSRGQLRPLCSVPPDDDKAPEKQELPETKADDKKAAAKKKLNDLLASLATTDRIPVERTSSLKLSQPKPRQKTKPPKANDEAPQPPEEQVVEPELAAATKEVAKSLGGDVEATESELLSTLRSHALDTSASEKPSTNLSELFVGLKVERSQSKPVFERPRRKRYDRNDQQRMQQGTQRPDEFVQPTRLVSREYVQTDIFGGEPLNIFSSEEIIEKEIVESACPMWDATHAREIQQTVVQPPSNAFVEMIQWTRQGKLWTFPIDNEIGLEEEMKIGFQEHVFLEHHLEGWCPRRGPIRHFMELVCTGLSKNPYLTVERKKAHIMWYKNYFEEKHDLLKEIGAIEA
ncbi:28S ribosomal protein S31, mitochondrial-like [Penaeus monodon]|uniref:28S ribosomal protein S31, mitochondrial-like n=1 Tax=Penaeus monodon TaxID=6687 RepID=UPI0018A7B3CF|nr:28S ribosomal protein S31, mitochondrial-like [Penaeus monodon]